MFSRFGMLCEEQSGNPARYAFMSSFLVYLFFQIRFGRNKQDTSLTAIFKKIKFSIL
jgi:hypothetical protein